MTAGSLYNHERRHKGDPSFMCRFCAKLFYTAGQLQVHERIHTKEKAFVCDVRNIFHIQNKYNSNIIKIYGRFVVRAFAIVKAF